MCHAQTTDKKTKDNSSNNYPLNLSELEEARFMLHHTLRKGFHTEVVLNSQKAHGLRLCEIHHHHHALQWPNIIAMLILSNENSMNAQSKIVAALPHIVNIVLD